jgi:hypothetical protein
MPCRKFTAGLRGLSNDLRASCWASVSTAAREKAETGSAETSASSASAGAAASTAGAGVAGAGTAGAPGSGAASAAGAAVAGTGAAGTAGGDAAGAGAAGAASWLKAGLEPNMKAANKTLSIERLKRAMPPTRSRFLWYGAQLSSIAKLHWIGNIGSRFPKTRTSVLEVGG